MKRKFKTLGLVLAAVFAMSAIAASVASAEKWSIVHYTSAPTTVTGVQEGSHVFTTNAGTVSCTTATFHGTAASKSSTTLTMTPDYTNCKAFGFINVPIHVNGCGYLFNISGTTNVECPAGKSIEITTPGCTTKVGAQHLSHGMTYTQRGIAPNRHIHIHTTATSIAYDECGTVRTNGTYNGTTTTKSLVGEIILTK